MAAEILLYSLRIYEMVLLARVLMSWIHPEPDHSVWKILWMLTEPILAPIRRALPIGGMGMDFSPIIVFLLLGVVERVLAQQLMW